jgi:hypothetical protein
MEGMMMLLTPTKGVRWFVLSRRLVKPLFLRVLGHKTVCTRLVSQHQLRLVLWCYTAAVFFPQQIKITLVCEGFFF